MSAELNKLLDELEARIDKLKIAYEQYFMGLEKLEPLSDRQEIARTVRRLQSANTRNTALKFRLNSLNQRFLSYQNYWNRIVRQIEAGTYKRDLARIQRGFKRRGVDMDLSKARSKGELEAAIMRQIAEEKTQQHQTEAGSAPREHSTAGPADAVRGAKPPPPPADAVRGGKPPPPPADAVRGAKPPPPPPDAAQTAADQRLKRLYRAYVAAKRKVGEPTEGITYDRLVHTLQKQVPAIQQKTGCKHVDFKIEIKNGKAVLKAVPKG
jgi:hypothetical protein